MATKVDMTGFQGYIPKLGQKRRKVNLDEAQALIRRTIEQKTRKDSELMSNASRLFGRPKGGLTPPLFKRALATSFGLKLTDKEATALWERYDTENIGAIPLPLLLQRIMPKDYTAKQWNIRRDEKMMGEIDMRKTHKHKPVLTAMPASWESSKWSMDEIAEHIQQKIVERTKRASDQYREAFALFGSPAHGISPSMFKKILEKLGFVLSNAEVRELFDRFDSDGSGHISFQELVESVMPEDYPEKPWNIRRDEEMMETIMAKKRNKHKPALTAWPASLKCNRMSMEEVETQIQQKIVERTKRASDQYREAFALFGSPAHGITPAMFKVQLEKLGMVLTDGEIRALFKKYDSDGSGNISFQELVSAVMPPDYPRKPWNIQRDEEMMATLTKKKINKFVPVEQSWPRAMRKNKWSQAQIEEAIQRKIVERTKRASDQYREAFALFGSPADGITRKGFKANLQKLGLVLEDQEVNDLFDLYDSDGSGAISFQELVDRVMPKDYTETTWYEKREDQNMALRELARRAIKEDSPFTSAKDSARSSQKSARVPLSLRSGSSTMRAMKARHRATQLTGRSASSSRLEPLSRTAPGTSSGRLPPRPEASARRAPESAGGAREVVRHKEASPSAEASRGHGDKHRSDARRHHSGESSHSRDGGHRSHRSHRSSRHREEGSSRRHRDREHRHREERSEEHRHRHRSSSRRHDGHRSSRHRHSHRE